MRASGWVLVGLVVATVPLAIGIATGQTWTPYVTYALWAVVIVVGIVRQVVSRRHPTPTSSAVVSAGDVYNELYLGRPRFEVSFGENEVISEAPVTPHKDILNGKISIDLRASDARQQDEHR